MPCVTGLVTVEVTDPSVGATSEVAEPARLDTPPTVLETLPTVCETVLEAPETVPDTAPETAPVVFETRLDAVD